MGLRSDVVGRTRDITGTVTIAGGRATTTGLRVGLLALTSGGAEGDAKAAPQFGISPDTPRYGTLGSLADHGMAEFLLVRRPG